MARELQVTENLFSKLVKQEKNEFPQKRQQLKAPKEHGVYVIRKEETVLHVGRTLRGKNGIYQRLKNHLGGASSFTKQYLEGNGATLRTNGYTYQCLVIKDRKDQKGLRKRALLEAYAVGTLSPKHLGLGGRVKGAK